MFENQLEQLNNICPGWTTNGSMFTNSTEHGGIIDKTFPTEKYPNGYWFIIFNDDREIIIEIKSLNDAIDAFDKASELEFC